MQHDPTGELLVDRLLADRPDPQPAALATGIGLRDREQQRRGLIPTLDRYRRPRLAGCRAGGASNCVDAAPHPAPSMA
jgi:hypothetical protein